MFGITEMLTSTNTTTPPILSRLISNYPYEVTETRDMTRALGSSFPIIEIKVGLVWYGMGTEGEFFCVVSSCLSFVLRSRGLREHMLPFPWIYCTLM